MGQDLSRVREGLWVGGEQAEAKLKRLQKNGIRYVLQYGTGLKTWPYHEESGVMKAHHTAHLTYTCVTHWDEPKVDMVRDLRDKGYLDFIREGVKAGGVLVQCEMGRSRSTTAVLAYLMVTEKLTFKDALYEFNLACYKCEPNFGFCNQLRGLEECGCNISDYSGPVEEFIDKYSAASAHREAEVRAQKQKDTERCTGFETMQQSKKENALSLSSSVIYPDEEEEGLPF